MSQPINPTCPKCNRPDTQFCLVGFMCRHNDCCHFFTDKKTTEGAVDILVDRYTGNNPENQPGQDIDLDKVRK